MDKLQDKVKLPKELADAIEDYRKIGGTNEDIMRMRFGVVLDKDEVFSKVEFDELLSALVNGYEVEQTPEDKVREYFTNIRDDMSNANKFYSNEAKCETIIFVLNLLNIKISGVNT